MITSSVITKLREAQYDSQSTESINIAIEDAIECLYELENKLNSAESYINELETMLDNIQKLVTRIKGVNK